jgi:hypothetical protein
MMASTSSSEGVGAVGDDGEDVVVVDCRCSRRREGRGDRQQFRLRVRRHRRECGAHAHRRTRYARHAGTRAGELCTTCTHKRGMRASLASSLSAKRATMGGECGVQCRGAQYRPWPSCKTQSTPEEKRGSPHRFVVSRDGREGGY